MQPLQQARERKQGVEREDNVLPERRQAQHGRHQGQVCPVKSRPDHGPALHAPPYWDNSGSGLLASTSVSLVRLLLNTKPPVTTCCSLPLSPLPLN